MHLIPAVETSLEDQKLIRAVHRQLSTHRRVLSDDEAASGTEAPAEGDSDSHVVLQPAPTVPARPRLVIQVSLDEPINRFVPPGACRSSRRRAAPLPLRRRRRPFTLPAAPLAAARLPRPRTPRPRSPFLPIRVRFLATSA